MARKGDGVFESLTRAPWPVGLVCGVIFFALIRFGLPAYFEHSASPILAKVGVSPLTANFFKLIARNRRLFAAADMMRDFRALLARDRGEVSADVATAHLLTAEQLNALKDALRVQIGKDVQVNTRVDPALLGGLVVKVGSKMIDSSLRTKLNNLKVAMKGLG